MTNNEQLKDNASGGVWLRKIYYESPKKTKALRRTYMYTSRYYAKIIIENHKKVAITDEKIEYAPFHWMWYWEAWKLRLNVIGTGTGIIIGITALVLNVLGYYNNKTIEPKISQLESKIDSLEIKSTALEIRYRTIIDMLKVH
jgi:hypothetical protein